MVPPEHPSKEPDLYEEGRRAWPDIALDREVFDRHVAERAPEQDSRASLRGGDLYIACACGRGDDRALEAFDRRYLTEVPSFLAGRNPSQRLVDDVRQLLRERLFVEGKIHQYSGRGSLQAWLRVVTLRLTSNLRRQDRHHEELHDALPAMAMDPELQVIRGRYSREFQVALRAALDALDAEERTLLRLFYLDGLNIDRIGVVFGVSRATVGRRMISVRERILDEMHRLLRLKLGASQEELASLLRAVRSELAMSLSVVLQNR
ncbi:MAG TPA: sigma-70 family RNA polymerase sigma factor [Polyangiaceae bacterium]|nr:sigma-70 family RNA polymerase sigma factor [Polyangiaceae bacterium]